MIIKIKNSIINKVFKHDRRLRLTQNPDNGVKQVKSFFKCQKILFFKLIFFYKVIIEVKF